MNSRNIKNSQKFEILEMSKFNFIKVFVVVLLHMLLNFSTQIHKKNKKVANTHIAHKSFNLKPLIRNSIFK